MKKSNTKGSRNERSVAHLLQDWTGYEFARTPKSGGLHWKKAHTSGDIVCIDEKHGYRFPFSIECKFHEELLLLPVIQGLIGKKSNKILEFWNQSENDAKTVGKIPLVFMRKNGMKKDLHFVMMSFELFDLWTNMMGQWKPGNGILTIISKDYRIVIMNSDDLIETEYIFLYKAGKKLKRNVSRDKV